VKFIDVASGEVHHVDDLRLDAGTIAPVTPSVTSLSNPGAEVDSTRMDRGQRHGVALPRRRSTPASGPSD
jgi:hypothetical protein